jgi:hypothetical protein
MLELNIPNESLKNMKVELEQALLGGDITAFRVRPPSCYKVII